MFRIIVTFNKAISINQTVHSQSNYIKTISVCHTLLQILEMKQYDTITSNEQLVVWFEN